MLIEPKGRSIYNDQNNFGPLLDKPLFIRTFEWKSTDAFSTIIATSLLGLPKDLLVNSVLAAPFRTSTFFTAKICLRIQALGTPFHQGCLVIYYKPNNGLGAATAATSLNDALISPSVLLYANQSTPACLEIPFSTPCNVLDTNYDITGSYYNYLFTRYSNSLGAIAANVVVPLESKSTNTIRVSYHVVFKDIKFYVPRNAYMVAPTVSQSLLRTPVDLANFDVIDVPDQDMPFYNGGKVTLQMETLAAMALPSLGRLMKDGIDRAGKKFFNFVGLDKPSNPAIKDSERMTTSTNFNHSEGVTHTDRMTMMPSHITTAESNLFPSDVDEMDMSYLLRKEQFIGNFLIKEDTAVGAVVCSLPMGPAVFPPVLGANVIPPPLQQQIASLCKYWKGSVKFHFKFSMSDMQTAKLLFVKGYNIGKFNKYPVITDLSNYDTETYEINKGGQEVVITCNYNAHTEMCFNSMDYLSSALQHGQLFVYVIQPTQYPSACLNYITCSVYFSCGDDFSFYGPNEWPWMYPLNLNASAPLTFTSFEEEPEPLVKLESAISTAHTRVSNTTHSIDKGINQEEETTIPSLIPSASTNTTAPLSVMKPWSHNMAPIRHLRDILRRYHQIAAFTVQPSTAAPAQFSFRVCDIFRNRLFSSPLAYLSQFFYAYKGGLRFRLMLPNLAQGNKIKVYYRHPTANTAFVSPVAAIDSKPLPFNTKNNAAISYTYNTINLFGPAYVPLFVSFNQVDCFLDFEIPCENPFRFNPIHQASPLLTETDIANDLGDLIFTFPVGYVVAGGLTELFCSFADETRFGVLNYCPSVYYSFETSGTPPINNAISSDYGDAIPNPVKPYFFFSA